MDFVDTHCHIHEATPLSGDNFVQSKWLEAGRNDPHQLVQESVQAGVTRLICVGTTLYDSQLAVALAKQDQHCWASIGIHPHEAKGYTQNTLSSPKTGPLDWRQEFRQLAVQSRVVAVGECGLDYFYTHSPKEDQIKLLEFQLEVAQKHNLPLIFHVRDAFDDFWPVFDNFKGLRGVIHSFTANSTILEQVLARDLYVGLNGIMTFTKDAGQLVMAERVPIDKLLLETDAPFLTPKPFRGRICEPKHVVLVAEFLAERRGEDMAKIAAHTTQNAISLFDLKENNGRK